MQKQRKLTWIPAPGALHHRCRRADSALHHRYGGLASAPRQHLSHKTWGLKLKIAIEFLGDPGLGFLRVFFL